MVDQEASSGDLKYTQPHVEHTVGVEDQEANSGNLKCTQLHIEHTVGVKFFFLSPKTLFY